MNYEINNQRVSVTDITMPFGSMVNFIIKWTLATVVATLILSVIIGLIALFIALILSLFSILVLGGSGAF